MDRLRSELEQVRQYGDALPPPSNESTTCEWVIVPLLWAMGYARHEIVSRSADAANKLPDYTILPSSEHTWYLEAKAWRETLQPIHVDQAMNYAHSNGRRWVVLTNGREWELYDDRIEGVSADRLVAKATLSSRNEIEAFLSALSRDAMRTEEIAAYANDQRLGRILGSQLESADSEVVRAIAGALRKQSVKVTGATIVSYFRGARHISSPSPTASKPIEPAPTVFREVAKNAEPKHQSPMFLMSPVSKDGDRDAKAILEGLLNHGWYVFADATAGKSRLKEGDRICFYESGKGVVAEARVTSRPEIGTVPGVQHPEKYRWRFRVDSVRFFFDQPVRIDAELRARLDAFRGKDPNSSNWSWFVQGTGIVNEHDFNLLVAR